MKRIAFLLFIFLMSCAPQISNLTKADLGKNNSFFAGYLHYRGSSSTTETIGSILGGGQFDINEVRIDVSDQYIPSLTKYSPMKFAKIALGPNYYEIRAYITGAKTATGYKTKDLGKVAVHLNNSPEKMYAFIVEVDKGADKNWVDIYELNEQQTKSIIELSSPENDDVNFKDLYEIFVSANLIKSHLTFQD